ncbi:MAG TPA: sigma-70 family RNA polymerase sigma factor [Candidatus Sulfotelmatobacter sp.]|nr:sigma-70 family RNA polymerase sigma factor [Candidatus Sulfotelmatobacter sp.]
MNDDLRLLREYARRNSEDAFAALVSRRIDLVYSVALRQVRDPAIAEEVTQAVFIILARKAGSLGDKIILSGWLCRTARYVAANALKVQYRRQSREHEAHMQKIQNESAADDTWSQVGPLLDTAMEKLGKKDHDALVLRFFENRNFRDVGAAMGASEDAAKMRVNRALEKLRKMFAANGVRSTTAIITGTMSANAVQAAPATLAQSVTVAAVAKGATASVSTLTLIKGTLKIMAWTKVKTAAVAGAAALIILAGTATVIIYNHPRPIRGIPKDWSVLRGQADQWRWANGQIVGHSVAGDSILASRTKYHDVTISTIARSPDREASIAFRMQDADNGYVVVFAPGGTSRDDAGHIALIKRWEGQEQTLASYDHATAFSALGQSAKITIVAKGPLIQVRLNDVTVLHAKDGTFSSGFIGLRMYGEPLSPCDSAFSNLTFY